MHERRHITAFLTGQSDPLSNALSPEQSGFFKSCGLEGGEVLLLNFPYDPERGVHREISLWKASVNNSAQYLRSRKRVFAETYRERIMERFRQYDRIVFIAGSCGLELLVNLKMPSDFLAKTWVFAVGPVSRSLPDVAKMKLVRGDRDFISKHWHRRVDHVVRCGHMDYLSCPEVERLFVAFHREAAS